MNLFVCYDNSGKAEETGRSPKVFFLREAAFTSSVLNFTLLEPEIEIHSLTLFFSGMSVNA